MTSLRGHIEASRRPGELGVHSMDHFNLIVPNLKVAQKFYASFGLDVREEANELGLYTQGSEHRWGVISEGKRKHMNALCFGMFEDDFDAFKRHIERQGVKLLDPPRSNANGLRFRDPNGLLIELRIADKTSPNRKPPAGDPPGLPGVACARPRTSEEIVRPQRLAHVLCFAPDVPATIDFYRRALGLRISDRAADVICFMHGIHGSDHHMIAFAKSNAPGLHHCSWDVGSIDQIGRGAMQMADRGFAKGWGLGRHLLGSNYFHYVRDPWGSHCEYAADIDYIPADCNWSAGNHPLEGSISVWAPEMPADFIHNYEASAA